MTWLTETDRDPRPAGDRLAAIWGGPGVLRIPGAHDPLAALLARREGFQALYLSGAALTASLALPDLGVLALPALLFFTRAIVRASGLPLVVDGDTGYGGVLNVVRTVREPEDAAASEGTSGAIAPAATSRRAPTRPSPRPSRRRTTSARSPAG